MISADIEFHDDHALLTISTEELNEQLKTRLSQDGWEMATNGHKENGVWYTIFVKHI